MTGVSMEWMPIVSGLVGGLVAMGISHLMRGRLARVGNGRVVAELVHEYRWHIRACGAVFIGGVIAAIYVYRRGWAASNDWRPVLIAFGGGVCVPIGILFLWLPRQRFAEFWVATAAKESFAPWVMTFVVIFSVVASCAAIGGYFWR